MSKESIIGYYVIIDEKNRIVVPSSIKKDLKIRNNKTKLFLQFYDRQLNVFLEKPRKGYFIPATIDSQRRFLIPKNTITKKIFKISCYYRSRKNKKRERI